MEKIINALGTEITVALIALFGVLFTAVVGLIGVLVGQWLEGRRHRRDVAVKMIDVALGILAGDVRKDDELRKWAVDLLAYYSKQVGKPLDDKAQDVLAKSRFPIMYAPTKGVVHGSSSMKAEGTNTTS